MDLVSVVILAVWVMLPAYLPNNIAVLVGGGPPIDAGREWRGKRILGDGKTWRGTIGGITAGIVVAMILNAIIGPARTMIGVNFPEFSTGILLAFPIGALLGDILASFVKRRTGRTRGSAFPVIDQLDFLVVALLVGLVVDPDWMLSVFSLQLFVVVLVLTPILHLITNAIAYLLGLKNEPW